MGGVFHEKCKIFRFSCLQSTVAFAKLGKLCLRTTCSRTFCLLGEMVISFQNFLTVIVITDILCIVLVFFLNFSIVGSMRQIKLATRQHYLWRMQIRHIV